ncbi:MAG: hypothetical protein QOJ19_1672, partial [Acidimicrobiia bacterium]|nr:hypothetical protein [Acidimicrobiia bacterium]
MEGSSHRRTSLYQDLYDVEAAKMVENLVQLALQFDARMDTGPLGSV